MTPAATASSSPAARGKKRGKAGAKVVGASGKTGKKFNSLIVAGLKRLMQIGISCFEGNQQELIQMAKHKFIDLKVSQSDAASFSSSSAAAAAVASDSAGGGAEASTTATTVVVAYSGNNNHNDDLEISKEHELYVTAFINKYIKSFAEVARNGDAFEPGSDSAIDKETYMRTQWQRQLYRRIHTSGGSLHSSSESTLFVTFSFFSFYATYLCKYN